MINSLYSTKIEIRESGIHGKGTFAKVPISKGEILFVKNGRILQMNENTPYSAFSYYWPIDDDYVLGAQTDAEMDQVKLFVNHSCDPNCGLQGINAGVAMRDIALDEEITFDYSTLDNENYSFSCNCGSPNCRITVTGIDWKIPELQKKYKGFFVTYLQDKIDKQ